MVNNSFLIAVFEVLFEGVRLLVSPVETAVSSPEVVDGDGC